MSHWIFDLPKVDGHCHVLDPARFPYSKQVAYHPAGQEIGTADYFSQVMQTYGTRHALLVGPNSGYAQDNRCLLDAIAQHEGRFKGVAVVPNDADRDTLAQLKAKGIVGIAFNATAYGLEYYASIDPLLGRLRELGMWAQFQVEGNQLVELLPRIERSGVKTMIDHCGRPLLQDGFTAPGFEALLALGKSSQAVVKLSGFAKFSQAGYPFDDCRKVVDRLIETYGLESCIWASDWPFLKAPYRLDYGTLLTLAANWFDQQTCLQLMWETPTKLFGWKSE